MALALENDMGVFFGSFLFQMFLLVTFHSQMLVGLVESVQRIQNQMGIHRFKSGSPRNILPTLIRIWILHVPELQNYPK